MLMLARFPFTQVWTVPLSGEGGGAAGEATRLTFAEEAFTVEIGDNKCFDAGSKLRIEYASMTTCVTHTHGFQPPLGPREGGLRLC